MGAGPTLARAMIVEDWIGGIATATLRCWQHMCDRPLVRPTGDRFLLGQMPSDFTVRVMSHSSSPIYTENQKALAFAMKKEGMVTAHGALRLINPPFLDLLLKEATKLEESQAQRGQQVLELKEREVKAKEEKARK